MSETILKVNGLRKSYKHKTVLNDVTMTIHKGDIYGFVGKNGAGKTTLIRILAGLVKADEGDYELFSISSQSSQIDKARKKICAMVEAPAIYPDLSALDNLKMQCLITGQNPAKINELLEFVDLTKTDKKKAKDFSLGMRQRLGIAMALVSEPQLLLLDEPINGLDPEGIHQVRELLLKMNQEKQVTILISSHILTELSLFATRYGFIDEGRIIREVLPQQIASATHESCYIESNNLKEAAVILKQMGYEVAYEQNGLKVASDIDLMAVCREFDKAKIKLTKHLCEQMDLEKYFMDLIGGTKK
ncbi:MAG: ATP-binding cassette domain-containing protein [Erysipelotrichaceae bacterium]